MRGVASRTELVYPWLSSGVLLFLLVYYFAVSEWVKVFGKFQSQFLPKYLWFRDLVFISMATATVPLSKSVVKNVGIHIRGSQCFLVACHVLLDVWFNSSWVPELLYEYRSYRLLCFIYIITYAYMSYKIALCVRYCNFKITGTIFHSDRSVVFIFMCQSLKETILVIKHCVLIVCGIL
jgi:hypothetical protein